MTGNDEFFWLALKPQQNFADTDYQKALRVISRASEFGFFIIKEGDAMKIMARTGEQDRNLFYIIQGMSVEEAAPPSFDRWLSKCVVLRRRTLAVLLDLKNIVPGNIYATLSAGKRDCIMGCLVRNCTEDISSYIRHKKSLYDAKARRKDAKISSKETDEHEWTRQRQGNAHYSCLLIFGVRPKMDLAALKAQKKKKIDEEREAFKSKVEDIKVLDSKAFKMERKGLERSYKKRLEEIEDYFRPEIEAARQEIKDANYELNGIISNILPNKFEDHVFLRRINLISGKPRFWQKIAEFFGAMRFVDPATFVPGKPYSKNIVLAERELAHFVLFPTEDEIQKINFEMGPNPTFMHGRTERIEDTDLDIDKGEDSDEEPSEESPQDRS